MITVEELLRSERGRPIDAARRTEDADRLRQEPTDVAVRFLSRARLLALGGSSFAEALYASLAGRAPNDAERTIVSRLAFGGPAARRTAFDVVFEQFSSQWQPLSGRGWLIDATAADTLSVRDWWNFSCRFLWFRLKRRLVGQR